MGDLTKLTIAEAREGLRARKFSAAELAEAHNAEVAAAKPLNAFITETPEAALKMAAAADKLLGKGDAPALAGIPIAVKDVFCTEGVLTTAGSHILDGFTPHYESIVTANLWSSGAVMVGKTNCDEFAMGSSNENSYYGPVINPWRAKGSKEKLVPGGSSGGSIRQPASLTGSVGVKPS